MTFKEYTEQHGLKLLKDDFKFIKRLLAKIHAHEHRAILIRYVEEYLLGMEDCSISHQKENSGRKRANLWLLEKLH